MLRSPRHYMSRVWERGTQREAGKESSTWSTSTSENPGTPLDCPLPSSALLDAIATEESFINCMHTYCEEGLTHACKKTLPVAMDSANVLIMPDMRFPKPASAGGTKTRYLVGSRLPFDDGQSPLRKVSSASRFLSSQALRWSKLYRSAAYSFQNNSGS